MTKKETLVEMLRNYRAAQETLLRSDAGSGGNPHLMPLTWNPSYRELERCLLVLSSERPKQARQLLARYVDPQVSRRRLRGKRAKDDSVTFTGVPTHSEVRSYAKLPDSDRAADEWDVVLASWPAWVRAPLVDAAVDRVAELSGKFEFYLPTEMLAAA